MKATFHFVKNEIAQQSIPLLYRTFLDALLGIHKKNAYASILAGDIGLYEAINQYSNPCETLAYLCSLKTGWDRIINVESFMKNVMHSISVTSISLEVAARLHEVFLSEESYIGAHETGRDLERQFASLIGSDFKPKFGLQHRVVYILTDPAIVDNTEYVEIIKNTLKILPVKDMEVVNFNPNWKELAYDTPAIMAIEEKEPKLAS